MKKIRYLLLLIIGVALSFGFSFMETNNNSNIKKISLSKYNADYDNVLAAADCSDWYLSTKEYILTTPYKDKNTPYEYPISYINGSNCIAGGGTNHDVKVISDSEYFRCDFHYKNEKNIDIYIDTSVPEITVQSYCYILKTPPAGVTAEAEYALIYDLTNPQSFDSFKIRMQSEGEVLEPVKDMCQSKNATKCSDCGNADACNSLVIGSQQCLWHNGQGQGCKEVSLDTDPANPNSIYYNDVSISAHYNRYGRVVSFTVTNGDYANIIKIWVENKTDLAIPSDSTIIYNGGAISQNSYKFDVDVSSWKKGAYQLVVHYESNYGPKNVFNNATEDDPLTLFIDHVKISDDITFDDSDGNCKEELSSFLTTLSKVLKAMRIIGPILVLVFSTVEYVTAVASKDAEGLKKANSRLIKRIILMVALIFLPTLVDLFVKLTLGAQYSNCVN